MKAIKHVYAHNFKSFEDISIELNSLNLIIGSNSSGKSNFVQIFKFVSDCIYYGVESAISIQGGINELRNANMEKMKKSLSN